MSNFSNISIVYYKCKVTQFTNLYSSCFGFIQTTRLAIMNPTLISCLLVIWILQCTMCHNTPSIYSKKYEIHKLTRLTHGYLFHSNGEVAESPSVCSFLCISTKCATWWYDESNLFCYMFQEYKSVGVKATEVHDANSLWSTIYNGKTTEH